jgi:hypothetical protein
MVTDSWKDGRTDGRMDMKLIVTFRYFSKVPKTLGASKSLLAF